MSEPQVEIPAMCEIHGGSGRVVVRREGERWSAYGLPEWLAGYVGLEADATSVRCIELSVIPGLLQTEDYMRKLYTLPGARLPAEDVEKRIGTRLKRQERLVSHNPLHLSAVVTEEVLIRCARDTDVGAAQLAWLLDRIALPNVELRVLPLDIGLHVGISGSFSLLSFPACAPNRR